MLFFHGVGGSGKSLLLRHLRESFLKRLPSRRWLEVRKHPDEVVVDKVLSAPAGRERPIACAHLDFAMPPEQWMSPLEAMPALLMLRRQLAAYKIRFPLFDFACFLRLQKTGSLSRDQLRQVFPPEELELAASVVEAFLPGVGSTVKYLSPSFEKWWRKRMGRKVDEQAVEDIVKLDPERQLLDELPSLWAEDLNAAVRAAEGPRRVALFFDAHEAFWTSRRPLGDALLHERDEWLRRLVRRLAREDGIVVVAAGQEPPRWPEAPYDTEVPLEHLDLQPIPCLSDEDAERCVEKAMAVFPAIRGALADPQLRRNVVATARVADGEVHPLYLRLCLEIVSTAGHEIDAHQFATSPAAVRKAADLLTRLFRYTDEEVRSAVRALAACRAFDREIYFQLGRELGFAVSSALFTRLLQLPFVVPAGSSEGGRFRIHDVVRSPLRRMADELLASAHARLEARYRENARAGDRAALLEAIYHANQIDWTRGLSEWESTFTEVVEEGRHDFCRSLLDLARDLEIDSNAARAKVARCEARYHALFSRHREAESAYSEARRFHDLAATTEGDSPELRADRALLLERLGELYGDLSRYAEAETTLREAAALYEALLTDKTDDTELRGRLGECYFARADYLIEQSRFDEANDLYRGALNEAEKVLAIDADDLRALRCRAYSLAGLAEQLVGRGSFTEGELRYREALVANERILDAAPDDVLALNDHAHTLMSHGCTLAELSRYPEAIRDLRQGLAVFDRLVKDIASDTIVITNRARVLCRMGEIALQTGDLVAARSAFEKARAATGSAIAQASDDVYAHCTDAQIQLGLARLDLLQRDVPSSVERCRAAEEACHKALEPAPDYAEVLEIRAGVALQLSRSLAASGDAVASASTLASVSALCDDVLRAAPASPRARLAKAAALVEGGWQRARTGDGPNAADAFSRAIEALSRFGDAESSDPRGLSIKAFACIGLAALEPTPSGAAALPRRARADAETAITSLRRIAPNSGSAALAAQLLEERLGFAGSPFVHPLPHLA
ncbi:MAG: tetratricopeptide repeat protein [Actinobacteria bacterium]|nr:tetratricopeptide repeat protein [Actinomycetota bacterium]